MQVSQKLVDTPGMLASRWVLSTNDGFQWLPRRNSFNEDIRNDLANSLPLEMLHSGAAMRH